MNEHPPTSKRALISVSDKTGVLEFAKKLTSLGFEIVTTGGTAATLSAGGVPFRDISSFTGFPEIMGGRVKTLHPLVHGGLLARGSHQGDMEQAQANGIQMIDLLCVNLYPFRATINKGASLEDAIENIDIGGPAMIRAAAKNYSRVTVVTDAADYGTVLEELSKYGQTTEKTRQKLAVKVFRLMQSYDAAVSTYLAKQLLDEEIWAVSAESGRRLRYGENSHQTATAYKIAGADGLASLHSAEILNGKEMSYNNYVDADAAVYCLASLPPGRPAAVVVKHSNPCGAAVADSVATALELAWEGDPISAFGGIVAVNTEVDMALAQFLKDENREHLTYQCINGEYLPQKAPQGKFIEILIAPNFQQEALEYLKAKSKALRIIKFDSRKLSDDKRFRQIAGSLLVQSPDNELKSEFRVPTARQFNENASGLAEFGMAVCRHLLSNAICLVREKAGAFQLMGMGCGQPNRIDAICRLALPKTLDNLRREYKRLSIQQPFDDWAAGQLENMVMVSDAFFPFDDSVREAASLGVRHIVQPGGSVNDVLSVKACDELNVAMALTGLRHFKH